MFDYRIFIRWAGECTKMCISRPKKFWEGHYLLRLPLPNGVAAPSVWNSLPAGIRAGPSPRTFCRLLKTPFSIRPSVPPSGSHKCLRFGLWSTLYTL